MDQNQNQNQNNGYFDRSEEAYTNLPPLNQNVLHPSTGFGVAALVCGICAIVFSCCCGLGILPGIVAIILALVDRRRTSGFSGVALGGLICGIIGTVLAGVIIATLVIDTYIVVTDPLVSSMYEEMMESMAGTV